MILYKEITFHVVNMIMFLKCKYTVPDYWDIGEVFARLIEDCYEENNVITGIKEVYSSWLANKNFEF